MKKDRALSLSLDNNLLTESAGMDYSIGFGYRVKDLKFRNNIGGRQSMSSGDLNIKADINYRDNITIIRNLDTLDNKVTAGQSVWSFKLSADYALRNLMISHKLPAQKQRYHYVIYQTSLSYY